MTLVQLAARIRQARADVVTSAADDAQGFAEALAELDKIAGELVSPTNKAQHWTLLHDCLDRVAAAFVAAHPDRSLSTTSILDLIVWSGSRLPPYRGERLAVPSPSKGRPS